MQYVIRLSPADFGELLHHLGYAADYYLIKGRGYYRDYWIDKAARTDRLAEKISLTESLSQLASADLDRLMIHQRQHHQGSLSHER